MVSQMTLEQLEQQIAQLPLHERLKLIARISEQLSNLPPDKFAAEEEALSCQRAREADEILALCDAAAKMWRGKFDAVEDIRRMRQERDEQIWPSKL